MCVLAELREATWPSHQRLEKRLDVKLRFRTLTAYREHLGQMWGFCAMLEAGDGPGQGALPDYDARRKLPLLGRDLIALGLTAGELGQLPRCEALSRCEDPAEFLGRTYVLEGATLGGRTLLPVVERHLGLSAEHGAAFLASYRDDVDAMWQRFAAALESWCSTAQRRDAATTAASATFTALEAWLCGAAP
jgi:heme oxygenase